MFAIIPRPGIPDVCKEATTYFCLNIQEGFKMVRRKKIIPFDSSFLELG